MRKRFAIAACVACVVFASSGLARAGLINLTAAGALDDLLGSGYSAASEFMTTDMAAGDLNTKVYSQAFYGNGLYAYVYQVDNVGDEYDAFVEQYTVGRFAGEVTQMGTFTGAVPEGFYLGEQTPESTGSVAELATGLVISFYYNNRYDMQIDVGEKSLVMYVLSEYAPGLANGNVINSSVASGPVIGAVVPEPGTLALLAFGGLVALAATWFQRRRTDK